MVQACRGMATAVMAAARLHSEHRAGCGVAPPIPRCLPASQDNPPCNTLFIGNLGDSVSEAELRGLFG